MGKSESTGRRGPHASRDRDQSYRDQEDRVGRELSALRHDLKQYVAAGILLTQVSTEEPPSAELGERLERLHLVFQRIDELLSSGSSGPQRVVDLVELVAECIALMEVTREARLSYDDDGAVKVVGDPVLLRRAVVNVLDNATRAAGDSGTVQVRVRDTGDDGVVEVADDGSGFGRIPSVTGQGMSVVDTAVRSCHGALEITSGPGPGTTVRLRIPTQARPSELS